MKSFRSFLLTEKPHDEYDDFFPAKEERTPQEHHRNRYIFHLVRSRIHMANTKIMPDVETQRNEHIKFLHHRDLAIHHKHEYHKLTKKTLPEPKNEDK